jgi:acyl-coenzyme A synthetase/AMP-(fatty) acid ligase
VPRRLEFVDALPRTETGKIRRAALRELASSNSPGGRA